jgi:hypothetical protein
VSNFLALNYPRTGHVARAIFDAVDNGEEESFPDPASAPMAAHWRDGAAKLLERQLAYVASVSS